jgi:RNA polymerase sigma factor (sigma-70 family)
VSAEQSSGRPLTVEAHLGLAYAVAKRRARGCEHLREEDLIQAGALGLMRALEKFEPERGHQFSTYANWWVRQSIGRAAADQDRTIRLPIGKQAQLYSRGELKRERIKSLDAELPGYESPTTLYDVLGEAGADPVERLSAAEDREELKAAMLRLTERERFVLRQRFWGELTLQEIGAELGVTRERIRQIEKQALSKLFSRLG